MRWIFALLAIAVSALVIMPIRYRYLYEKHRCAELTLKVIPTLICAAFAAWGFFGSSGDRYALLVLIALVICAAGDVVLGIRFAAGGALFLTGHLFYISAFLTQQTLSLWNGLMFVVALIGLWLFCQRYRPLIKSRLISYGILLYSAALAVVLCLSLPLPFITLSERTVLAAVGAVLFVISDMGVCHSILANTSKRYSFFMLGVYYLAQLCLGMSAFGG